MDARPLLARIAKVLEEQNLEAVLIGNAAAALQGAPVTTVDFDFMFRKTPANLRKLKALARALDAVILRPYYPASDLFRIVRDEDGLQHVDSARCAVARQPAEPGQKDGVRRCAAAGRDAG